MSIQDDKETTNSSATDGLRPRRMSRRALVKTGTMAMPAILTLQSGAALARSSNLISAASPDTTVSRGRTICLDTDSVYPATRCRGVYDAGEPSYLRVNVIRGRDHYTKANDGMQPIGESQMRLKGGPFFSKCSGGWTRVNLPRNGIVISATAASSFLCYITDRDARCTQH